MRVWRLNLAQPKPGVRIGTAELYRVAETALEVLESLAVGQRWLGDERSVLSPRHVPAKVLQVQSYPSI